MVRSAFGSRQRSTGARMTRAKDRQGGEDQAPLRSKSSRVNWKSNHDMPADDQHWDKQILPRRGLLDIPLRELWRYRDLVWLMAKRNLTAQYKQTVLGPSWFVIQPLLTTLVFSFIFARMAGLGTDGIPHFLFYMGGLVLFSYFGDLVNKTAITFTRNAQLFGKVYFPRLAMPLSQTLTSLAGLGVQLGV